MTMAGMGEAKTRGEPDPDSDGHDIRMPVGLVRLSDPNVGATPPEGPEPIARLLANAGRVTLFHAREKTGKSTLLRAAVAAVTRGQPFLDRPTVCGHVLWVGEEPVEDLKGKLQPLDADLDRVLFIRELQPDPEHNASLRKLLQLLRPVWVIIDTWQHYLWRHRVKDTAGPGTQGALLSEVVDLARESAAAVTVSHHNIKNKRNEYRDSSALGAAADMIVSFSCAKTDRVRRLKPSGRWNEYPLDIRLQDDDLSYEVTQLPDETDGSSRQVPSVPIGDRVLLHLLQCASEPGPSRTTLSTQLGLKGRRYKDFRAAIDELTANGVIALEQRPDTTTARDRGYLLTPEGRARAESLRERASSAPSEATAVAAPREGGVEAERASVSTLAVTSPTGNGDAPSMPSEATGNGTR